MKETLAFYPNIGVEIIKLNKDKTGESKLPELRVWLAIHTVGSGFMSRDGAFEIFTKKSSPYYLCGKKRFGMILKNGEGLFWEKIVRVNGKGTGIIKLVGKNTLTKKLGIQRLEFHTVKIQTKFIFMSLKHTKAMLLDGVYNSFPRPVSRISLEKITGVCTNTQKQLEKLTGTIKEDNYLYVPDVEDVQESAWKSGGKVTRRLDTTGKITGKAGTIYTVERLPNTYTAKQEKSGKGSRTAYNRLNSCHNIDTNLAESRKIRLYNDAQESKSKHALYQKQYEVFGRSTSSPTGLGNTNIWVKTW